MTLDVRTEEQGDLLVVILGGELDIYTVAGFRRDIESIEPGEKPVAIDLTDVTLIDSSGLGALVSLLNRVRTTDGRIGLICPHRRLRRVFEIAGLRRAFVFADDLPTLRAALAGAPDQE
jgi:anti-anti-sigma factor